MPKNKYNSKTKGKGEGVNKKVDASVVDADDDLDDILAELLAEDMRQLSTDGSTLPAITADSSVSSNASPAIARALEMNIPEATIEDAVKRGDAAQLKRWGRQGVRVKSVTALLFAVGTEASNAVLRILVEDLGADVNQVNTKGHTSLMVAASMDLLHTMRCLVVDLGADVDQADIVGVTSVFAAAYTGRLAALRCLVN
jgi:ankyrin repeat protein